MGCGVSFKIVFCQIVVSLSYWNLRGAVVITVARFNNNFNKYEIVFEVEMGN